MTTHHKQPSATSTRSTRRQFITAAASATSLLAISGNAKQVFAEDEAKPEPGIEGHMAPELEVDYWIDADGEPGNFSMAEARGKWVFLKCFQNWCPGCHKSGFPTLQAFSERFHDHPEVAIAAVQTVFEGYSSNTQAAVRELQLRYELPITMGHDPGKPAENQYSSTMVNYRTGGTPWLILVNPEGVVVYNHFHVNTDALINHVANAVT